MWGNDITVWQQLPFVKLAIPDGSYILTVSFNAIDNDWFGVGNTSINCAFDDLTNPGVPRALASFPLALSNSLAGEIYRGVSFHDVQTFASSTTNVIGFSCKAGDASPSNLNAGQIVFSAVQLGSLTVQ